MAGIINNRPFRLTALAALLLLLILLARQDPAPLIPGSSAENQVRIPLHLRTGPLAPVSRVQTPARALVGRRPVEWGFTLDQIPDSLSIWRAEVEIRRHLTDVLRQEGPAEALALVIEWSSRPSTNWQEALESLVAVRALPGLAREAKDPKTWKEAESLTRTILRDRGAPAALRQEALSALFGTVCCYDTRDRERLMRPVFFAASRRTDLDDICSAHEFDRSRTPCEVGPLTDGGFLTSGAVDDEDMALLLQQIVTEEAPSGGGFGPEVNPMVPLLAVVTLSYLKPDLARRALRTTLVLPDAEGRDGGFTSRSISLLIDETGFSGVTAEVLADIAMTAKNPRVIAEIFWGMSENPTSENGTPDDSIVGASIPLIREFAEHDPEGAILLAQAAATHIQREWMTDSFATDAEVEVHAARINTLSRLYQETIEAMLAIPTEEPDVSYWLGRVETPWNLWVGDEEQGPYPFPSVRRFLISILYQHQESPRARRLLECALEDLTEEDKDWAARLEKLSDQ